MMIDRWLDWVVAFAEIGLEYVASYLMTIEGMVVILIGVFCLGLLSRIRSV